MISLSSCIRRVLFIISTSAIYRTDSRAIWSLLRPSSFVGHHYDYRNVPRSGYRTVHSSNVVFVTKPIKIVGWSDNERIFRRRYLKKWVKRKEASYVQSALRNNDGYFDDDELDDDVHDLWNEEDATQPYQSYTNRQISELDKRRGHGYRTRDALDKVVDTKERENLDGSETKQSFSNIEKKSYSSSHPLTIHQTSSRPGFGGYNSTLLQECHYNMTKYRIELDHFKWEKRLNQLIHFKKDFGHCRVPSNYKQDYNDSVKVLPPMGRKVGSTKAKKKKKRRSGSVGTWSLNEIDALEARELYNWIQQQRRLYKKLVLKVEQVEATKSISNSNTSRIIGVVERSTMLTPQRVKILQQLGLDFNPGRGPQNFWRQRVEELQNFKSEHGHCNVPLMYPPNPKMANFVKMQRYRYKCQNNNDDERLATKVNTECVRHLMDIGFEFEVKTSTERRRDIWNAQWNDMLHQFKQYVIGNGDGKSVRQHHLPHTNAQLCLWIDFQKKSFNTPSIVTATNASCTSKITPSGSFTGNEASKRRRALHRIGFFNHMDEVLNSFPDNYALSCVSLLNDELLCVSDAAKNKTSVRNISALKETSMLNEMKDTWLFKEIEWMEQFQSLKHLKANCVLSANQTQSFNLVAWVQEQRQAYSRLGEGNRYSTAFLTEEKVRALDQLDFAWNINDVVSYEVESWSAMVRQTHQRKQVTDNGDGSNSNLFSDELILSWLYEQQREGNKLALERKSSNSDGSNALERFVFLTGNWREDGLGTVAKWNQKYRELQSFVLREGHSRVPLNHEGLGAWVQLQRNKYNSLRRVDEGRDRLDALGFNWTVDNVGDSRRHFNISWYQKLARAVTFQKSGDQLPFAYSPDQDLLLWLRQQHRFYMLHQAGKSTPLSEEKIVAVDGLTRIFKKMATHDAGDVLQKIKIERDNPIV